MREFLRRAALTCACTTVFCAAPMRHADAQRPAADTSAARAGWPAEPNPTQLLFAPTGRMLDPGATSFGDTYLLFVHADHGITGAFSLGGGMSMVPTTHFTDNVFYLTPKIGLVRSANFNLAAGALVGFAGHARGSAGALYAVATSGGPDASLTYGVGWFYSENRVSSQPGLIVGGLKRLGRNVAFISENYVTAGHDNGALVSYGVRLFGDRLSVDLAFWNAVARNADRYFPGIPYLAFAMKF